MLKTEDLLIRYCSHIDIEEEMRGKIKNILRQDLNWENFLQKANNGSVSPLLYKTILNFNIFQNFVPERIVNRLKNIYYYTVKENIIILKTAEKIVAAINEEGIETMVLKGPILAEIVYGDIGLRPIRADIDILVKRGDLANLDAILKDNGYSTPYDIGNLLRCHPDYCHNTVSYSKPYNIPMHLHWHIINFTPYSSDIIQKIDMDRIWSNSEEMRIGDIESRTLSIHHQIIYLCMHALQHSYQPLILLCDINEFLRVEKERIDWNVLIEESFKFGLSRYVYYGLYVVSEILETDIPQSALVRLKPEKMSLFERRFIASVLEGRPVFAGEWLIYLGMNETLAHRISFLRKTLFPSKNELAFVRQKDISQVNVLDYIKRFESAVNYAAKALFNWLC